MEMNEQEKVVKQLVERALGFLAIRARSRKEVVDYLSRKASTHTLVELAMARIEQFNLLNDDDFGEGWIRGRIQKGKGPLIILRELQQKGLAKETVKTLLAGVPESEWEASARNYLTRKKQLWRPLSGFKQKNKIYQLLSSRGFSGKIIERVIDDVASNEVQ